MKQTKKRALIYFRMEEKLARKLDTRISRAGYAARSDFFTAVAYIALYGSEWGKHPHTADESNHIEKLPKAVTEWIGNTFPRISEEEIQTGLHAVIADMLYPVIAMKGADIAYENTWEDIRNSYHERCGVWATESELREAYQSFAAINKAELIAYREQQLQKRDAGEN